MVDPIVGAMAAKVLGSATEGSAKTTSGLMQRVLGPATDEIGEALGRYTAFRMKNVKRIVEGADNKVRRDGKVPPRVAHRVLEDGSYCDDEVIVDYLSGVLAASRSADGRDDRGVSWSTLITGMSSYQVRAHFLLYREWAARLSGRADIRLGDSGARGNVEMTVELNEFYRAVAGGNPVDEAWSMLSHVVTGLARVGLVGDQYNMGTGAASETPYDVALVCQPTPQGLELYGWAMGLTSLDINEFTTRAEEFDIEPGIPRLTKVLLSRLESEIGTAARSDT